MIKNIQNHRKTKKSCQNALKREFEHSGGRLLINLKPEDKLGLIETMLNLSHQGEKERAVLMLGLLGLGYGWHVNEFIYYKNEAEL